MKPNVEQQEAEILEEVRRIGREFDCEVEYVQGDATNKPRIGLSCPEAISDIIECRLTEVMNRFNDSSA